MIATCELTQPLRKLIGLLLATFPLAFSPTLSPAAVQPGEMFGYLLFDGVRVPGEYNAGFSRYASAWPLPWARLPNRTAQHLDASIV